MRTPQITFFHGSLIACMLLSGCQKAGQSEDGFETIRQLVCDGQYEAAIPRLKAYSGKHNSRAGLFLGKAHLALADFTSARSVFETTMAQYPDTPEAHKCKYKLALLSYLEGDTETAKVTFVELAERPSGPLAAEAKALARFLQ